MHNIKESVTSRTIYEKSQNNVKEVSPSGQNEMVPHRGLDLQQRVKHNSSGKYIGKLYRHLPHHIPPFNRQLMALINSEKKLLVL